MKELTIISANLYLVPAEPPDGGEMRPMVETILVLSEPKYTLDDAGGTIRQRVTDPVRFHTNPTGLRELVRRLTQTADLADAMAKRVAAKKSPTKRNARESAAAASPASAEEGAKAIEGKYGEISTTGKRLHPGEPVFLLRATDPLAPAAIRDYADNCQAHGCSAEHVAACLAHADRIVDWQNANPELVKKRPD